MTFTSCTTSKDLSARSLRRLVEMTFISISLLLFFLFSPITIYASEFETGYMTLYTVGEDGNTKVQTTITLKNLVTNLFPTQYSLTIQSPRLSNISVVNDKGPLATQVKKGINQTNITIFFTDKVVGKDVSQLFVLTYETPDIVSHAGSLWEITIPKTFSEDSVNDTKATLSVPSSFGEPLYFKPQPLKNNDGTYTWTHNQLSKNVISAAFGRVTTYEFSLTYHLLNSESLDAEKEIALPPDTAFQTVVFTLLTPAPLRIKKDTDGNWIAVYTVSSNKTVDVAAKGYIETSIHAKKEFIQPLRNREAYIASTPYWQSDSISIQTLSRQLKTPEAIYRYVVDNFSYDYSRVTILSARKGALDALESPSRAICTEFTDATVAILRAAGIPAREVNGYAITNNKELKPLSLAADILHAWPEYYDEDLRVWVPIDPTWENTTGGVDYFHQFDLSHITLAIHGTDDSIPKPAGGYKVKTGNATDAPTKDVIIEPVSMAPAMKIRQFEMDFTSPSLSFLSKSEGNLKVTNPNGGALYNIPIHISAFGAALTPRIRTIPVLLPGETLSTPVGIHVYNPFTLNNLPVTFEVGPTTKTIDIAVPFSSVSLLAGFVLVGGVGIFVWKRRRLM